MVEPSFLCISINIFASEQHMHTTSINTNYMSINRRFLSFYINVREKWTGYQELKI